MKMNKEEPVLFCKWELVLCNSLYATLKHLNTIMITDFAAMTVKRMIVLSLKECNIWCALFPL